MKTEKEENGEIGKEVYKKRDEHIDKYRENMTPN